MTKKEQTRDIIPTESFENSIKAIIIALRTGRSLLRRLWLYANDGSLHSE